MAAPSCLFTIRRVARILNEDEQRPHEIAMDMEPEDGCLRVLDLDDDVSIVAFTAQGIESLRELLADLDPKRPYSGIHFIAPFCDTTHLRHSFYAAAPELRARRPALTHAPAAHDATSVLPHPAP
jgi:hypothetical protein